MEQPSPLQYDIRQVVMGHEHMKPAIGGERWYPRSIGCVNLSQRWTSYVKGPTVGLAVLGGFEGH